MQRIILAIQLQFECPPPQSQFLICWLNREGHAQHSYVLGKPRMIDVRVGDVVQHPNGRSKVVGIEAWRQHLIDDEKPISDGLEGYIVTAKAGSK